MFPDCVRYIFLLLTRSTMTMMIAAINHNNSLYAINKFTHLGYVCVFYASIDNCKKLIKHAEPSGNSANILNFDVHQYSPEFCNMRCIQ